MAKKVTLKEVFRNDNWQITEVKQGVFNRMRVSARKRSPEPDGTNTFCEYGSYKYLVTLAEEYVGKHLLEFSTYRN